MWFFLDQQQFFLGEIFLRIFDVNFSKDQWQHCFSVEIFLRVFGATFSGAVAIFFLGKIFLTMFDVIFSGPVAAIFLKVQQNNTSKHREWVQTYKDTERTGISHYLWGGIPWQPPYVEMWLPHINIFTLSLPTSESKRPKTFLLQKLCGSLVGCSVALFASLHDNAARKSQSNPLRRCETQPFHGNCTLVRPTFSVIPSSLHKAQEIPSSLLSPWDFPHALDSLVQFASLFPLGSLEHPVLPKDLPSRQSPPKLQVIKGLWCLAQDMCFNSISPISLGCRISTRGLGCRISTGGLGRLADAVVARGRPRPSQAFPPSPLLADQACWFHSQISCWFLDFSTLEPLAKPPKSKNPKTNGKLQAPFLLGLFGLVEALHLSAPLLQPWKQTFARGSKPPGLLLFGMASSNACGSATRFTNTCTTAHNSECLTFVSWISVL